jgi:hypothetical protein
MTISQYVGIAARLACLTIGVSMLVSPFPMAHHRFHFRAGSRHVRGCGNCNCGGFNDAERGTCGTSL